jgi:hypothetical protein
MNNPPTQPALLQLTQAKTLPKIAKELICLPPLFYRP